MSPLVLLFQGSSLRTACLLSAVSLPLNGSSGGTCFRCMWCWCCALLWSLKTNQSAYQTSPSRLSPAHLFTTTVPRLPHSSSCLWQEDGTVHRASCTRTEGVTDRLAAGLLKSSWRVTHGFCSYFCAWSWSGSAGNTKVGKSAGPRRRRLTSQARKYWAEPFLFFNLGSSETWAQRTF